MCDRNPLHCIVPPHMIDEIATNGTPMQQQRASRNQLNRAVVEETRSLAATAVSAMPTAMSLSESGGMERVVFDAVNTTMLPGRRARGEGDPPTGDAAVDEAYDGAGATYALYEQVYDRISLDGRGMPLQSTVHYGKGYDNAFWNGRQMAYGDGDEDLPEDERIFNRFTIALDIIGHELTHGVIQFSANLRYQGQSGALNESWADVFGALVKQRLLGQTAAEADWTIGAGLLTPNVNGIAIRSMKAPGTAYNDPVLGTDPQPGHMNDYKNVSYDKGGVHINSGIPNRAFYIIAKEIGGFAWEKAGMIWYTALRDLLRASTQFQEAANLTYQAAGQLYGMGSLEQQAVLMGWKEVGLFVDVPEPPPPAPPAPEPPAPAPPEPEPPAPEPPAPEPEPPTPEPEPPRPGARAAGLFVSPHAGVAYLFWWLIFLETAVFRLQSKQEEEMLMGCGLCAEQPVSRL